MFGETKYNRKFVLKALIVTGIIGIDNRLCLSVGDGLTT